MLGDLLGGAVIGLRPLGQEKRADGAAASRIDFRRIYCRRSDARKRQNSRKIMAKTQGPLAAYRGGMRRKENVFGIISRKALARSGIGPYLSHPSLIDACVTQVAQEQISLGT